MKRRGEGKSEKLNINPKKKKIQEKIDQPENKYFDYDYLVNSIKKKIRKKPPKNNMKNIRLEIKKYTMQIIDQEFKPAFDNICAQKEKILSSMLTQEFFENIEQC